MLTCLLTPKCFIVGYKTQSLQPSYFIGWQNLGPFPLTMIGDVARLVCTGTVDPQKLTVIQLTAKQWVIEIS